jgi:hypothetical protein
LQTHSGITENEKATLTKERGVTVFANDLWISATDNLHRFEDAGVADRAFPIHAEAHALPYAYGFFDVANDFPWLF